ncbi:CAP domain-containing protein [Mucilaginibacter segetis]|uniref:CAP domain-containing protein n=1 Tax=Mucilaginibacter segetis TaxID=2793071 RepID=A0A934UMC9_9SPHI|nr:CAP domain-containing protein [Mucilaginibacter segetis]MBK0378757.1 CAP domain-containing protein [Mucilaginibacter segetis]
MKKYFWPTIFSLLILLISKSAHTIQPDTHTNFKQEFLALINKTRKSGCNCGSTYMPPVPPLVWNNYLELAAKGHARDMADNHYFNHTSKDGRNMEDRIVLAGYIFKGYKSFMIGENIAYGQNSIQEVMDGWFKSEGHCKNLMNPGFKEVGVAEDNRYWVQDFGGRESFSLQQQKLIKSGKYRLIQNEPNSH